MNKFVVAILACVAGSALGDYLVRDAAGVMIDVPKDGGYVVEFNPYDEIPQSDDESEFQPFPEFDEIEYSVYYYYVSVGRKINATLYIDNEVVDTHIFEGEFSKHTYKLEKTSTDLKSIAFTVSGECATCFRTITIIFWIRLKREGKYIHEFTEENPMPLYYRSYSPMFDIKKGEVKYMTYDSDREHFFLVYKHQDYSGDVVLKFNENEDVDKKYKVTMDQFIQNVTFMEGTTKITAHAADDEKNVYIEMGAFDSASSTIKAISFALLALCALLF